MGAQDRIPGAIGDTLVGAHATQAIVIGAPGDRNHPLTYVRPAGG